MDESGLELSMVVGAVDADAAEWCSLLGRSSPGVDGWLCYEDSDLLLGFVADGDLCLCGCIWRGWEAVRCWEVSSDYCVGVDACRTGWVDWCVLEYVVSGGSWTLQDTGSLVVLGESHWWWSCNHLVVGLHGVWSKW